MANDAPTSYVDLTGSIAEVGVYRAASAPIGYLANLNARYHAEKLYRGDFAAGDTRQVHPQAHAEQSAACGLVVPRSLVEQSYSMGSANAEAYTILGLPKGSWTEVDRQHGDIAGFLRVASEIRYQSTAPNADEVVLWKIESRPANDSAAGGAVEHYIIETSGTAHVGAPEWHTINGQLDAAGGATKELTIDGPTSVSDPGSSASRREFVLYANGSGTGTIDLAVHFWHVFETLTGAM